jgi:hypothetical protein
MAIFETVAEENCNSQRFVSSSKTVEKKLTDQSLITKQGVQKVMGYTELEQR